MSARSTRLGILGLLGATLVVLAILVAFARYPGTFRRGSEYRASFKSVAGLNTGDEVRYGGLPIGAVTDLAIDKRDPTRINVTFKVRKGTPIHADTHASISQVGLLGAPYLQLETGSANAPALPPGSVLPTVENPSFQDAMRRLAQFLDRADTLLGGVEQFARASPLDRLQATLARADSLIAIATLGTRTSFAQLDRTFARVDTASARLALLLERSERVLGAVDTVARTAGPQLAATQREALASLRELRTLLADLRDALSHEGGIDRLVRNMTSATDNIARLSERLERDPTSVLKQREPPSKPAGPRARD